MMSQRKKEPLHWKKCHSCDVKINLIEIYKDHLYRLFFILIWMCVFYDRESNVDKFVWAICYTGEIN